MKNLKTLKYKMERFPETIIPYDYLIGLIKELREILRREESRIYIEQHPCCQKRIKEILGE